MKEKLNIKVLSIAIRQAVEDLISCERSSRYKVDMAIYHNPCAGACYVCFAGAAIARRTPCDHKTLSGPSVLPRERKMLYALDRVRSGSLSFAGHRLEAPTETQAELDSLENSSRHSSWLFGHAYSSHPGKFKRHLLALADELEERGL